MWNEHMLVPNPSDVKSSTKKTQTFHPHILWREILYTSLSFYFNRVCELGLKSAYERPCQLGFLLQTLHCFRVQDKPPQVLVWSEAVGDGVGWMWGVAVNMSVVTVKTAFETVVFKFYQTCKNKWSEKKDGPKGAEVTQLLATLGPKTSQNSLQHNTKVMGLWHPQQWVNITHFCFILKGSYDGFIIYKHLIQ